MLQVKLVNILGLIAILIGIIVNLIRVGVWSSITFAAIGTLVLYLASVQVSCLMTGRCLVTSWFAAAITITLFGTLAYFYINAIIYNIPLPSIDEQPIATVNPALVKTRGLIKDKTKVDIYRLENTFNISKGHKVIS